MKAMVFAVVMVAVAGLTAGHRRAPVTAQYTVVAPVQAPSTTGPFPVAVPAVAPAGAEFLLLVR